jgi:hypothetical protein
MLSMLTDRCTRLLLVPAVVFIATAMDRNYQTDLWHHLARGRIIVNERRLLNEDRFTFTVHGQTLQDVNWGWQVLFFRLHELGGLPLVQTVNSALLALMMFLLVVLAWRRSDSVSVSVAVCIVVFFGLWQLFIIRPQTISLLLFVLLLGILEEATRRRWLLLFPPVVMAIWVNVHGGFPIGLALIGCYVVASLLERLWPRDLITTSLAGKRRVYLWFVCLLFCVTSTLANPYGWRVYEYVSLTSSRASGRPIDEWLPPSLELLTGKIWALSLLLLLSGFAFSRRRPNWREICSLLCFLPLACGSVRMVAWWLLICSPVLAARLAEMLPRLRQFDTMDDRPSLGNAVACSSIVLATVLSLPWLEAFNPALARPGRAHRTEYDLHALADHLRDEAKAERIFTRFDWGEYLGWSLAPHSTVFMDGRIEIIPDEVWLHYTAVTRGRADWEEILDHYGVDCLVLDVSGYHHDLLPQLERSANWRQVEQQGNAIRFVRRTSADTIDSPHNLIHRSHSSNPVSH